MNRMKRQHFVKGIFSGLLGGLVIVALVLAYFPVNRPVQSQEIGSITEFERTITQVVDQTQDAVVSVGNYQVLQSQTHPLMDFYGFPQSGGIDLNEFEKEAVRVGSGSGVVYKIEGDSAYVITNNHVIEGADKIELTMHDGSQAEAELLGADSLSDLAVLRISADHVSNVISFADSDQVQVGSIAIAIGSPVGERFASSVTQGIVSGLDRSVPVDTDGDRRPDWEMTLIQTDAAINPGNSGGALVNSAGQLIGINSSKLASAAIEGMGFAIPSNDVVTIASQLETQGYVERPVLGIQMVELVMINEESRTETLGLPADMTDGVMVWEVAPDSPAAQAGLESYDVIVSMAGEPVTDSQSIRQILYGHQVGDTMEIEILRGGKAMTVTVELTEAVTQE